MEILGFDAPGTWPPAVLPTALVAPQNITTRRFASAGFLSTTTDDPPSTAWVPRLLGDVEIGQSAADALGIGGRVALGIADIALWDADGGLADSIRYGSADGRRVVIRTVPASRPRESALGGSLAAATVAFQGIVRAVNHGPNKAAILTVTDIAERLATPLQTSRYLGTGGLEGPTALAGRPKPVALGRLYNVAPIYLGTIDLGYGSLPTYQTNWRAITAHDAVRIRGVAQTAVVIAPTVGQFIDIPASGVFQLGSSPDGPVTADVRGDSVPIYVATVSTVIKRLVQSLGPAFTDAEISTDAFAFADTDMPGDIGWYRGAEEITASDAVAAILASCGAVLAGGRGGLVRLFDPLASDVPQITLPSAWVLDCQPLPLPVTLRPLPNAVTVGWKPNWAPATDLAGSVSATERQQLASAFSGPARSTSSTIAGRVAQQRDLAFAGLYWAEADALARAAKWKTWLEHGPRLFQVTTDRYLGSAECGDLGRLTYPAYGLDAGVRFVVVGWREQLGARRLTLTLATLPEA